MRDDVSLFHLLWSDLRALVWKPYPPSSVRFWIFFCRQLLLHSAYPGVVWYRYGHWAFFGCPIPVWRHLHQFIYLLFTPLNRILTATEISYKARIGPGLLLLHSHQVLGEMEAGAHLTVHDGVLIGQENNVYPVIGHNVMLGARAIVIGDIHLGSNCKIGAGAVVVKNVPADATAVGNPARILEKRVESVQT